jgi:hypothetical protein
LTGARADAPGLTTEQTLVVRAVTCELMLRTMFKSIAGNQPDPQAFLRDQADVTVTNICGTWGRNTIMPPAAIEAVEQVIRDVFAGAMTDAFDDFAKRLASAFPMMTA